VMSLPGSGGSSSVSLFNNVEACPHPEQKSVAGIPAVRKQPALGSCGR
jgi:hypothetical protein